MSFPMNNTRERLIDVGFELFGRGGFHGVGLDQIISEAGVSKQTFYNHFASKDDLVLAVLEHRHAVESEQWNGVLARMAGQDPRARLYCLIEGLHHWLSAPEWRGCIFVTAAAEFPLRYDPAHKAACTHVLGLRKQVEYLATRAGARAPTKLAEQLTLLIEGTLVYHHITGNDRTVAIASEIGRKLIDEQLAGAQEKSLEPIHA